MKIDRFIGGYRFLSNFYLAAVYFEGFWYPSVEHAYQAAKFPQDQRKRFRNVNMKPGEAKRLGRGKGNSNWKTKSLTIMAELLRQKFSEPKLAELLIGTNGDELIEGNDWHDTFYGVCNGKCRQGPHDPFGENKLGKLLMQVRDAIG